jgi:hypothetical protein
VLFVTLDSCRYDTFAAARAPNLKGSGDLHKAMAPGNFTYASHAAMFVGFTPGVAAVQKPYINPKFGKLLKMEAGGWSGREAPYLELQGRNIIEGFNKLGFVTLGSGAVGWFNPATPTAQNLIEHFQSFHYPGTTYALEEQITWLLRQIQDSTKPVFAFLNIGETHVPYYYKDAPWDASYNPCEPFSDRNDADECRRRQIACIEFVDDKIKPLLDYFRNDLMIITADHGDCWGEDGLWEHGIHHEKVLEVPLIIKLPANNQQ